ncbi:MAG: RNA polymerase sigma factor [Myxococcota bacterium]
MDVGDEADILAAARKGDAAAFRQLVAPRTDALFRVAFRILGDKTLAEDAVQEALWNAYRGLEQFDARAQFSTWLYRIAVNAALSIRRAQAAGSVVSLRVVGEDDPAWVEVPDTGPQPVDVAGARQLEGALTRALDRLTDMERAAFVLRHLEQRSLEEIASTLELSVNACKQAIFRAVRKLRPALLPWRTEA